MATASNSPGARLRRVGWRVAAMVGAFMQEAWRAWMVEPECAVRGGARSPAATLFQHSSGEEMRPLSRRQRINKIL
jgi:hypothetical protein